MPLKNKDIKEIIDYVLSTKKRRLNLSRSKKVQREVFDILEEIFEEIEYKGRKYNK